MFEHLWMSGVVAAFLSFGIKAGMGIGARLFNPQVSKLNAFVFLLGTFLSYALLFAALGLTVTHLNLLNYLDRLSNLIQYGMLVHLTVALGLLVWGARLLLGQIDQKQGSSLGAGLFLVLPCPVCATVILLNLTLALSLSSLSALATTLSLFGLFWTIIAATLLGLWFFRGKTGVDNMVLGAAMALIAIYFFLTVLIAPIYPKIKPAFAMAVSNTPVDQINAFATFILAGVSLFLSGIGFARTYFKKG